MSLSLLGREIPENLDDAFVWDSDLDSLGESGNRMRNRALSFDGSTLDPMLDLMGSTDVEYPGFLISSMPDGLGPSSVRLAAGQSIQRPPGCAPDAIKLFAGNIPKSCTEAQLLPFFETIGKVEDLVVVRDRVTRESKGSAFVWYASRAHAEQAITQFNMRFILPDPTGKQTRPLAIRKAQVNPRPAAAKHIPLNKLQKGNTSSPLRQPGEQGSSSASQQSDFAAWSRQEVFNTTQGLSQPQRNPFLPSGVDSLLAPPPPPPPPPSQRPLPSSAVSSLDSLVHALTLRAGAGDHPSGSLSMPQQSHDPSFTQQGGGSGAGAAGEWGLSASAQNDGLTLSLPLDIAQLAAVAPHMHSVRTIAGTQVVISPALVPGVFELCLAGTSSQISTARIMLLSILGGA